ncbi:MAG: CoA pyrophosphatase [Nitrososphaerota archaeon]
MSASSSKLESFIKSGNFGSELRKKLSGSECTWPDPSPGIALSSVLVPIENIHTTKPQLILTRRSTSLRTHAGEVAFPGGKREASESPREVALREANEEVGLGQDSVEIIGCLKPVTPRVSKTLVVPVLGEVKGRPQLLPNREVDRVFRVDLADFITLKGYTARFYTDAAGEPVLIHYFNILGELIWGATARIIVEMLQVVDNTFLAR